MPLTLDLSSRIAVITGATGQLGRVMALTLAKAGADVALHYHGNATKAAELQAEIEALGRRACTVQADVADLPAMLKMRDQIEAALGTPDIVVACAVAQVWPWSTVLEEDLADYESQFRSCVLHNVNLAKAFLPAMQAHGTGGRYIGINTECAMQVAETQSAYTSGKRGMDAVLRVLAKEVGPDQITVNQVAPGWTISEQDRINGTEANEAYAATVPLRRRGTDQEVANVVAFLASDLASYITGAFIPVCGGHVMPTI
ncbi:SDR family NAD(P)-dependent oxidoreductase [Actomonas aquatica]|uniref:SDR family oxidoreductase n=1 Tax=Actomonas aquatica TaxID=2866162 RepID=A0ABZ1CCP9_9BACT|nr:SDR family oxidoreductase [Opitutus sp. WL0086]WRQ88389.1 SDR family oxidoreductase [Opitutus sp. WL0086]